MKKPAEAGWSRVGEPLGFAVVARLIGRRQKLRFQLYLADQQHPITRLECRWIPGLEVFGWLSPPQRSINKRSHRNRKPAGESAHLTQIQFTFPVQNF